MSRLRPGATAALLTIQSPARSRSTAGMRLYGRAPLVECVTLDEMAERYREIIKGCKEKAVNEFIK